MSSPRRRREESEDVLELRDLDSQRIRAFLIAAFGLMILVYAMGQLLETLGTSLDQQEDLVERLDDARRSLSSDPKPSASEPPKT